MSTGYEKKIVVQALDGQIRRWKKVASPSLSEWIREMCMRARTGEIKVPITERKMPRGRGNLVDDLVRFQIRISEDELKKNDREAKRRDLERLEWMRQVLDYCAEHRITL